MQVTLCDPYLSALEAFARRRAIQIYVHFTSLRSCDPARTLCTELLEGRRKNQREEETEKNKTKTDRRCQGLVKAINIRMYWLRLAKDRQQWIMLLHVNSENNKDGVEKEQENF